MAHIGNKNAVGNKGWTKRKFQGRRTKPSEKEVENLIARNKARTRPWKERFEEKLDRNGPVPPINPDLGECWEWKPAQGRPKKDRGLCLLFKVEGVSKPFYHWLYEDENGPSFFGRKIEADHLCLNWRCARPSHIEPVSHQENMRRYSDARKKGWY